MQVLRDHGQAAKYHHSHIGWNARMDGIQAAVLSVKLRAWRKAMTRVERTRSFTINYWPTCQR